MEFLKVLAKVILAGAFLYWIKEKQRKKDREDEDNDFFN